MSPETSHVAPIDYRLPLGDGWSRIRLDEHAEGDVKTFLDECFAGIPDEAAETARIALAQRFALQIGAARAKSGLDLYVPADPVGAVAATGSVPAVAILAAQVVIPTAAVPDPVDVVARVAATNPAARTGIIAGTPAVRIDHGSAVPREDDGDPAGDTVGDGDGPPRGRHVEYVMAVPNDPGHRWLSVALTAQDAPEETVAEFDQAVAELEF